MKWLDAVNPSACVTAVALLATLSCRPEIPRPRAQIGPPRIEEPAPQRRVPPRLRPDSLPRGARAHFPAYDGAPFYVTLPPSLKIDVSATEVLESVITPVLKAVGFDRGRQALALPASAGVRMPTAKFGRLAQAVAYEYANSPQLMRPKTQKMLDVFLGKVPPGDDVNGALQMGEGMNFAQFVAGIERLEIQYPFQQVDDSVPIEHTLLVAARWEGQTVTSVRGALFNRYAIANRRILDAKAAIATAIKALGSVRGVVRVTSPRPEDGPSLVLLPYGTDGAGIAQLHYAYRMILRGVFAGEEGPFLLWLDAQSGGILKLQPLLNTEVSARGIVYNRDPGVGTTTNFFGVDPASGGQYVLSLAGVLNRVDYQGDGYNSLDVSIADNTNGSNASFANFDQTPINDASQALCASGTNKGLQQVNFFGTLYRYYQTVMAQGIFTPFPTSPWSPKVESASAGCNAWSNMDYGACQGYTDATCPNFANDYMNFGHDNTIIGHEFAHNITQRLTNARPSNWCSTPPCAIPVGWGNFHDLADFWADHFESTNCTAGWVSKNIGGVNNSLNCLHSTEGGGLPRLHEVTVPFNPGAPGDHFPEHRAGGITCDYCDGQIGAAALWQVRVGMRSKCRPSGLPQFGVRFQRALKKTGFLGFSPPNTDLGTYQLLYDLELQMVDEWATAGTPGGAPAFAHNGPHTTNKVTAGFASAGVFLVPSQCLDGDPTNNDPGSCPSENGADAVVDIDDNDLTDDLTINGVNHPEHDFLRLGGPAPTFQVWTGPRYKLDGTGGASTLNNPATCNATFRVEVSPDAAFPVASTINSPWTSVDRDPSTPASPECYGTWTPNNAEWTTLQAGGALTRIYYRARTRDATNGNERLSTLPGNGLWTVPPPYAVITVDGRSDY